MLAHRAFSYVSNLYMYWGSGYTAVTKRNKKLGKKYKYNVEKMLFVGENVFLLPEGEISEKTDSERQETVSKSVKKRKGPVTKT